MPAFTDLYESKYSPIYGQITGTFTVTLPVPSLVLGGTVTHYGPFTVTLPALTSNIKGISGWFGPFNITLPTLLSSISGARGSFGPLNITLPSLTSHLGGVHGITGPVNITVPGMISSLAGNAAGHVHVGSFNILLLKGIQPKGPLAVVIPSLVPNLNAHRADTFNIKLPLLVPVLTGRAKMYVYGPMPALPLPVLSVSLTGEVVHGGAFNVTL